MPKTKKPAKSQAAIEAENLRLRAKLKEKDEQIEALESEPLEVEEDTEVPALPGASKAAEIVADLKGNGSFEVYKLDGGKQSKLATHDIDAWPEAMESLVKRVGPGDYLTIFRDGEGHQVGRITRTFDAVFCGIPAAVPKADNSDLLAKFLEIQARKDESHDRQVSELRLEMQRQSEKSMTMMLEMVKSMTASPMKSIKEFAEVQALLRPKEEDPADRILDTLELMRELKGEAREEDESPLMKALNRFAESFAAAPRRGHTPDPNPPPGINDRRALAASPQAQAPQPSPEAQKPTVTPPNAASGEADQRVSLDAYRASLIGTIQAGVSPVDAVQIVMQKSTLDEQAALRLACEKGDWDALAQDEFLSHHKPWLDDFRKLLTEALRLGVVA